MAAVSSEKGNAAQSPGTYSAVEAFVAEAVDIRDLLCKYRVCSDHLRDDLSKYVLREFNEEGRFLRLGESVDQAEMASLRDPRFVEFLARREAEAKATNSRSSFLSDQTVACCSVSVETPNAPADFQWWAKRMRSEGSSWLLSWAPDAVLPLVTFRGISDVWHEWKGDGTAYNEELKRMLEDVYSTTLPSSSISVRYCCFGNGELCVFPLEDTAVMSNFEGRISQMSRAFCDSFSKAFPPLCSSNNTFHVRGAALISGYYSELMVAVAMTCDEFHERVSSLLRGQGSADGDCHTTLAARFRLTGDAWDTLTFVHPDRLKNTVRVRGFFFKGRLALVEQLGAEVDVTPLFFSSEESDSGELDERWRRAQRLLSRTLTSLYTELQCVCEGSEMINEAALPPNAALTVAVVLPSLEREEVRGVLLDVRPVSPQMPLDGRVSWMDVCAVGRQCAAATAGTHIIHDVAPVSGGSSAEESSVFFRFTRLPVATLQPYDAVSRRVFPLINSQFASSLWHTRNRVGEGLDVRRRGVHDVFYLAVKITAPICVVAVALGIVRWARR